MDWKFNWLKEDLLEGFHDYVKMWFFIGLTSLQVAGTFWLVDNILP